MPEMKAKRKKLEKLHTELEQAVAILDTIIGAMVEAGGGPTSETALYGLMGYLERISEEIDVNVTALFDDLLDAAKGVTVP